MTVFGFSGGPTYRAATREEQFTAALAQPMNLGATLWDQAKGGVLESFGLGTAIRSGSLPQEAPTIPGVVVQPENGEAITLPDTPQMRRRQTVFGNPANVTAETPAQLQARRDEAKALDEDAYKASAYFRANIPWDAGMTEDRAAALAMMDDAKSVRQFFASKRPFSSFIANLAGQAVDPINYIPIAGNLVKAASVARFGKVAGAALTSALDAAGNTAIFAAGTADARGALGDDVSWESTVSQIATAALIGGAFGTVGGVLGRRADARVVREAEQRLATLRNTQDARVALNEGIDALVRGEDVRLSPNATEPLARIAGEAGRIQVVPEAALARGDVEAPGNVAPSTIELTAAQQEAHAALAAAGYDIKALAAAGRDVSAVMRDAPLTDAGKAVQRQEIDALSARIAEMAEAQPVNNSYGPGLVQTNKAPPNAKVYESGMGEAFTKAERKAQISKERGKLAALKNADAKGEVLPEILDQLRIGRGESIKVPAASARAPSVDTSVATPEPTPEGRKDAEIRIAKPDDYKALAAQYRVDPETGSFFEEGDIQQLAVEGRLTEQDVLTMADVQSAYDDGAAYGEALKSVAGCLI